MNADELLRSHWNVPISEIGDEALDDCPALYGLTLRYHGLLPSVFARRIGFQPSDTLAYLVLNANSTGRWFKYYEELAEAYRKSSHQPDAPGCL